MGYFADECIMMAMNELVAQSEMQHRLNLLKDGIWITSQGEEIKINNMETTYISKCISNIRQWRKDELFNGMIFDYTPLEKELIARGTSYSKICKEYYDTINLIKTKEKELELLKNKLK